MICETCGSSGLLLCADGHCALCEARAAGEESAKLLAAVAVDKRVTFYRQKIRELLLTPIVESLKDEDVVELVGLSMALSLEGMSGMYVLGMTDEEVDVQTSNLRGLATREQREIKAYIESEEKAKN